MRSSYHRSLVVVLLIQAALWLAVSNRAGADPGVYEAGSDPGVGFNLISWWNFGDGVSKWEDAVQSIHNAGFQEVSISPIRFAETSSSATDPAGTIATTSGRGPELSHIAAGIARAKSLGMRVTVNPFVGLKNGTTFFENANNPGGSSWRGLYDPTPGSAEWTTFWDDYENYLVAVAQVAEANGADSMTVGTELKAITNEVGNNPKWSSVISAVDAEFTGTLGYAANWDIYDSTNITNTIWENFAIDYIGIDSYFTNLLNNSQADASGSYPNPTFIGQVENAWNNKLDNVILPFAAARKGGSGMPVEFTEVGYLPYNRTTVTPQNSSGSLDKDEQNMAFEGLIRALDGRKGSGEFLATHIWTWGMPGTGGNLWDMGVSGGEPQANNVQTSQWLSTFVNTISEPNDPPLPPGATQVLYSFETGVEGFFYPNFEAEPASTLSQVTGTGATEGTHSLAITKPTSPWTWDARVQMGGDQLAALQAAVDDDINNFILEIDVTYVDADLPGNLTDMNMHVSFQSTPNNIWSQAFPFADINGATDQSFHVEIPFSAFDQPAAFASSITGSTFHIGFAGSWTGDATVYIDRIALTDTTFIAPDNADFDGDGNVDGNDFLALQASIGITSGTTLAQGDANNDGAVNHLDLAIWEAQYGTVSTLATVAAVPEPATSWSLLVAGILLLRQRSHWSTA